MKKEAYPFWMLSPQIFILGAGASRAAFPNGDKYGRKLPLMYDFISTLNLEPILKRSNIKFDSNNIEDIYDTIYSTDPYAPIISEINDRIFSYFSAMQITDNVTIYDKLILALQSKDVIFSFNWDPLLLQAYSRNVSIKELPKIHFLHGNVAIGVCTEHKRVGHLGNKCSICGNDLTQSKLLYPIKNKNYNNDPFISSEWKALDYYLNDSFILTIFGYGAPKTDINAVELMKKAWTGNKRFDFNEIEIIDIQPRKTIEKNWSAFFHKTHYAVFKKVSHTFSFSYARRSCEHWGDAMMMCQPWHERKIPNFRRLDNLQRWVLPLVQEELDFKKNGVIIPRYSPNKNY